MGQGVDRGSGVLPPRNSRRSLLRLGAAVAGGAMLGRAGRAAGETSPPGEPEWSQTIGAGVVDRPYGLPSEFEKEVIRRDVPWLTASKESSVSFTPLQSLNGIITPNGLFFERFHAGRVGVAHPFHRMPGQRGHGMARGAAQLAAIHPRHDRLRRMDRRAALDPSRGG